MSELLVAVLAFALGTVAGFCVSFYYFSTVLAKKIEAQLAPAKIPDFDNDDHWGNGAT